MKKILVLIVAMMLFIPNIYAEEKYYVTDGGNELTKKQYQNLIKGFTLEELNDLDFDIIEAIKNDENIKVSETEEVIETLERDYIDPLSISTRATTNGTYSSASKRINIKFTIATPSTCPNCKMLTAYIYLDWLNNKSPKVASYDVWGIRFDKANCYGITNTFEVSKKEFTNTAKTEYKWIKVVNGVSTEYMKDYGFGTVFKVDKERPNMRWKFAVVMYPYATYGRVSYQHAQGNISLSNAGNFDISSSGYGGVLLFKNSTAKNLYDQMNGAQASLNYN